MKSIQAATTRWMAVRRQCEGEISTPIQRIATEYVGALHTEMIEHERTKVLLDNAQGVIALLTEAGPKEQGLIRTDASVKLGKGAWVDVVVDHDIDEDGNCSVFAVWVGASNIFHLLSEEAECEIIEAVEKVVSGQAEDAAEVHVPSLREEVAA